MLFRLSPDQGRRISLWISPARHIESMPIRNGAFLVHPQLDRIAPLAAEDRKSQPESIKKGMKVR
jgi:hypothetical protein